LQKRTASDNECNNFIITEWTNKVTNRYYCFMDLAFSSWEFMLRICKFLIFSAFTKRAQEKMKINVDDLSWIRNRNARLSSAQDHAPGSLDPLTNIWVQGISWAVGTFNKSYSLNSWCVE
jgi:hypothetical protein